MSNFPDFSTHNYQLTQELGHNLTGGRITYKANHLPTSKDVVIKYFQLSGMDSWKATEYDAYEQEVQVLRRLNHPGIPRYLDSFETADGFCLVQEYLNAQSLVVPRTWKLEEIKHVARSILKILVYLQSQTPPVIHRDIKPENILIDEQLNVYLVDFGFARIGGGDVTASSMVKGTMGFMPPEQLFNRELTTASDLYGLGATLICLLTGVRSVDIGSLIDSHYCIHFRHLVPPLQRGWISWLEKIVKPSPKDRFPSAKEALEALEPIDLSKLPKVRLSKNRLEIKEEKWGEKLTETITVTNPIPDTILSGTWEVAHHPSDPPHTPDSHSWIKVTSYKFEGNLQECQIVIDTSKLHADTVYERDILLHTNSYLETCLVEVEVHTGSLPKLQKPNYLSLSILFAISLSISFVFENFISSISNSKEFWYFILSCFLLLILVITEQVLITSKDKDSKEFIEAVSGSIVGSILGIIVLLPVGLLFTSTINPIVSLILGIISGAIVGSQYGFRMNFKAIFTTYSVMVGLIALLILFIFSTVDITSNLVVVLFQAIFFSTFSYLIFATCTTIIIAILWQLLKPLAKVQISSNIPRREAGVITIMTTGLGVISGIVLATTLQIIERDLFFKITFSSLFLIALSIFTVLLLGMLLIEKMIGFKKQNKIIYQYSHQKDSLINP